MGLSEAQNAEVESLIRYACARADARTEKLCPSKLTLLFYFVILFSAVTLQMTSHVRLPKKFE